MNYQRDKLEPFWWGMFSVGGVIAALLVPVTLFLDGLAVPLGLMDEGLVSYERWQALLSVPWIKLYLFVLVVLPLYHAAHRIRFSLYELGMREFRISMDVICYGAAVVGTLAVGYVLVKVL